MTKENRDKTQMTKIINERGDTTIDFKEKGC